MRTTDEQLALVIPMAPARSRPTPRRQTGQMYTEAHARELDPEQRRRVAALAAARDVAHEAKGLFSSGLTDSYDLISLADWILNGGDTAPIDEDEHAAIEATLDTFERDEDGDLVSPSGIVVPGGLRPVQERQPDPTPEPAPDPFQEPQRQYGRYSWDRDPEGPLQPDHEDTAPEPGSQPVSRSQIVEDPAVPPRRVPGNPIPPVSPLLAQTLAAMEERRLAREVTARIQELPPEVADRDPLVTALVAPPPVSGLETDTAYTRKNAESLRLKMVNENKPSPMQRQDTGALVNKFGAPVRVAISGGYEVKEHGFWRPARPDDWPS